MRKTFDVVSGLRGQVQLAVPPVEPFTFVSPDSKAKAAPTCARCKEEPAAEGRKSCPGCLEYDRIKAALRRLEAHEKGKCLVCLKPVKPGTHVWHGKEMPYAHCDYHLEYYRFHTRRG